MKETLSTKTLQITRESNKISYTQVRRFVNYFVDLGMLITGLILFATGVIKFIDIWANIETLGFIAALLTDLHDVSGIFLGILVFIHFILHWKWMLTMTKNVFKSSRSKKKKLDYFIDLGMLISFLIVFIAGILKIPSLRLITQYFVSISEIIFILHDWAGIILTILALSHVVIHWKWMVRMTRKMLRKKRMLKIGGVIAFMFLVTIPIHFSFSSQAYSENSITIEGIGVLTYNPEEINTIRTDLFRSGHYSIFDILVDLDNRGKINMDYYFDSDMDTHVINTINGTANWWYTAYYDGGWNEPNVFRMDHYPYKPKMSITISPISGSKLQNIYNTYEEETQRLNANNGTVVIPSVIITSPHNNLVFNDVEVTSHNLRNDFFQDGIITAIDVIMSLGDQGLITYNLKWYSTIGTAEVKNYWVSGINQDTEFGKCGFVYEVGDLDYQLFKGNHIHIPSDIRIIISPEYEEWFWICL